MCLLSELAFALLLTLLSKVLQVHAVMRLPVPTPQASQLLAVSATMAKAKLRGLLWDRSENTTVHHIISGKSSTQDEWAREFVTPH